MEQQMVKIKHNLKATYDKEKCYANKGRIPMEFKVGEHVFLKVKPNKSSLKLESYTKLAAKYHCSFEILDRIGPVAYMITLPTTIKFYNMFHV
jgi:hypothetical protein